MRTTLILIATCCTAVLGFVTWDYLRGPSFDNVGIAVQPAIVDLGNVQQNQEYSSTFVITNHFEEPVEIVDFIKRCDCTSAVAEKTTLAPGEGTPIHLTWRSGMSRGDTTVAIYALLRRVGAVDERDFGVPMLCRAHIECHYDFSPERISFLIGVAGQREIQFVPRPSNTDGTARVVVDAHSTDPAVSAEVSGSSKGSVVRIQFNPDKWPSGPAEIGLAVRIHEDMGGGTLVIPVVIADK